MDEFYRTHGEFDSRPDPVHVEYYSRVNQETREKAVSTRQYVITEYQEDAPFGRGYGLVYTPSGRSINISSTYSEECIQDMKELVRLANVALGQC